MEDLCQRIPFVAVMIFRELNNQSLIKNKEASRELSQFMCNERFYWLRIIKIYNKNFFEYQVLWKKVLEKTPVNIIRQLAYAIRKFFMQKAHRCCSHRINACPPRFEEFTASLQWTPLHMIAYCGLFEMYKYAHGKTGQINPPIINGLTPLHFTAFGGHLKILELIMDSLEDKNPGDNHGLTPLHLAAENGHLKVCEFIMDILEDKNPGDNRHLTPLHKAAVNGHLKVCEFIMEILEDKNPGDNHGITPLHKAAQNGYWKVCELIMEGLEDKNPGNSYGWTPLHFAAVNDNLNVCELIMKSLRDKNPPTPYGYTPLHIAAIGGHFNLCKLICKNVSKIDIVAFRQNDGYTPIKFAVFNKKWSIVWLLARFQSALQ